MTSARSGTTSGLFGVGFVLDTFWDQFGSFLDTFWVLGASPSGSWAPESPEKAPGQPREAPKQRQTAPRRRQEATRQPQKDPKRPQHGPKISPRWPQDGPNMAPGADDLQKHKILRIGTPSRRHARFRGLRAPRNTNISHSIGPSSLQEEPNGPQEAPRNLKTMPTESEMATRDRKMATKWPQIGPKIAPTCHR